MTLHTHLIVRDDALALYGFATEEERELFLMLLGVQSVGSQGGAGRPLGRARRGSCWRPSPPATSARLQAAPGVGKRTAERIIVELREKVGATLPEARDHRHPRRRSRARWPARRCSASATTPIEIDELLDGAAGDSTEELIAHALRSARR